MDEVKKGYRMALFIGIAMITSVFIYAVVVEVLKASYRPFRGFSPSAEIEMIRYIFLAIVMAEFFLIKFIRNRLLWMKRPAPGTPAGEGFSAGKVSKLISVTIVTYALCESVGIFGLVLFLVGGKSSDFYIFMVLSLIFFAVYFPRYHQWEA